jgi:hypothetical protein
MSNLNDNTAVPRLLYGQIERTARGERTSWVEQPPFYHEVIMWRPHVMMEEPFVYEYFDFPEECREQIFVNIQRPRNYTDKLRDLRSKILLLCFSCCWCFPPPIIDDCSQHHPIPRREERETTTAHNK